MKAYSRMLSSGTGNLSSREICLPPFSLSWVRCMVTARLWPVSGVPSWRCAANWKNTSSITSQITSYPTSSTVIYYVIHYVIFAFQCKYRHISLIIANYKAGWRNISHLINQNNCIHLYFKLTNVESEKSTIIWIYEISFIIFFKTFLCLSLDRDM